MHPVKYKSGNLYLEDINLSKVALKYGTPTYVYSSRRIIENLENFRSAFKSKVKIHFAMKANSNVDVLKLLRKNDVGVDVVSGGEIKRALLCGFKPSEIIFSGVAKSVPEINLGLKLNISTFNIESLEELSRVARLAEKCRTRANISLRLNPDVDPKTHPYISTGFKENKFGMEVAILPDLLVLIKRKTKFLNLTGLDFHIGSQVMSISPFIEAVEKIIPVYKSLIAQGFPLKNFDIGGGIGIPYENENALNMKHYAKKVEQLLRPLNCHILTEPGRTLVGDAGVLLTEVEYIKRGSVKYFAIVNTGMHHLLRPALYNAYHKIYSLKKSHHEKIKYDVVGPICESSDWLAKDRMLPKLKASDKLAICDAGAYGFTMASDYNLQSKPAEILI
jgi:diaminopimelate decarboxylase